MKDEERGRHGSSQGAERKEAVDQMNQSVIGDDTHHC